MKEPERRDVIQSLERGLTVILAFSDHHPQLTLNELARATSLSKPTVRRILITLQELGYARRYGRLYALTPRVLALGYAYLSSLNLTETAQPHMERLVEETQLGCSLATLDDTDVVSVTRVPTYRFMTLRLAAGTRLPAYATSLGHVLLADLPQAELDRYLAKAEMRPLAPRTMTTPEQLVDRLADVRAQGWAMVDQELEEGIRSISAPVRDANRRVIAALGMSTVTTSTDLTVVREKLLPRVVAAATHISDELGASFSRDVRSTTAAVQS